MNRRLWFIIPLLFCLYLTYHLVLWHVRSRVYAIEAVGDLEQMRNAKRRVESIQGCMWFDDEKEKWIVEKKEDC